MRDWQNHEAPHGFVNRHQAARMLGVSARTFRRMLKSERVRVYTITDPIPGVPWTYSEVFYCKGDIEIAAALRKG